ncbi:MAG TPA: hypothetical protein VEK57_26320 [Thermoanaerobaculia bacterium]|nr:hypothetical protein [Thermoanaerobaculia bacterium]
MTRIAAILLSFFGPIVPGILLLLFLASFDNEPPTVVTVGAFVLAILAALGIRVHFAMWYARDKGRSSALGLLALFGLLGWLFLIVTEDRKGVASPRPDATAEAVVA